MQVIVIHMRDISSPPLTEHLVRKVVPPLVALLSNPIPPSIKALEQATIKIDKAAERCVNVLLGLISTRVSYVIQWAAVPMKVRSFLLRSLPSSPPFLHSTLLHSSFYAATQKY